MKQQEAEALRAKQSQSSPCFALKRRGLQKEAAEVTESAHSSELRLYERKLHLSSLLERAGQELGLVEEVLIAEYGPDVPIPVATTDDAEPQTIAFDVAEQEARLRKAERALAELGRINPLALEEFAALEQRHSFLSEQLTDLQKTRADLVSIIEAFPPENGGHFCRGL